MISSQEILQELADKIIANMRAKISSNGSDFTGNLSSSLTSNVSGNRIEISMPLYGKFVDEGTKPHMPPVDAIEEWAEAKGLNAWAVAINIKRYGTEPHPFIHTFGDTVLEYKDTLKDLLGIKIGTEINDYLKQSIVK